MPNRLVCNVIEEMRVCSKTRNYSYMDGLTEEVQTLVNRMEGKLLDNKELGELDERIREAKTELKRLKQENRPSAEIRTLRNRMSALESRLHNRIKKE